MSNKEDKNKDEIIVFNDLPLGYKELLEEAELEDTKQLIILLQSLASGLYYKKISRDFLMEDNVLEMYLSLNEFITQSSICLDPQDQKLREEILKMFKTRIPKDCYSIEDAKTVLKEGTQNYLDFVETYEWICEQLAYLFEKATHSYQYTRKVDYIKGKAQQRTLETIRTAGEFGYPYHKDMGRSADEHIQEDDEILMADDDEFLQPMGLWNKRKRQKFQEDMLKDETKRE